MHNHKQKQDKVSITVDCHLAQAIFIYKEKKQVLQYLYSQSDKNHKFIFSSENEIWISTMQKESSLGK